ncbi:MAG: GNAT family N-acetyltransferase [Bacteroidales bacterium]|jgi:ribosomal-protein-alanine N-acetyltransferase|nr:GNAT family N-acetyltransferase [Bacteroidales bacterium]MDD2263796.1 GNAT family N-acetyltransferase [Bacteroidales bacterium]MDD2830986.1 GNAT family N-acetyltransferase [Bacteroidales bacterium]MDD3208206.1 GNAT family N-acetyltransferase [Bacteroidales bacterium]MDD3696752.1 GNAT family N-acetyltransferase [Bacteroidales bacterium]
MNIICYDENNRPCAAEKKAMVEFLFLHLENFGDARTDIEKAIAYALKETASPGGFILKSLQNETMTCVVVVTKTGMSGFVPENLLVYIATNNAYRGQGIGKKMMQLALKTAQGNVALHVEPHNPAKLLYEKLGFTNKYLEMRYIKSQ